MAVRRFKKGSYNRSFKRKMSRRGRSRRSGRTFQSRVKKVILKTAETKMFDIGHENLQLYHNLGYGGLLPPATLTAIPEIFDPWSKIVQGTNRWQRIGDKITPRSMTLKLWVANKSDRPNTMIRLIVAILPKSVGNIVTDYDNFNPFQIPNEGTLNNNMLLPADADRGVRFLYDRIIRPKTGWGWASGSANTKEFTSVVRLNIKRKSRDIVFNTFTQEIVNKPLAVYMIPYEQYSTATTSNVTSFAMKMRMFYKDI